jgi:hypothetical protein
VTEFAKGGILYVSAYLLAKYAANYVDPLLAGWIASGIALGLRYEGPTWIRWKPQH